MPDTIKSGVMSVEEIFARYHGGWDTKNPDLIASLHSEDTVFQLHDGTPPVYGREALRASCMEMFERFEFEFEMGRFFHGTDHWVFEWAMVLQLKDGDGVPFAARVEMLDLVTIDDDYLVKSKDVYMNGRQASAAF
jgi:SnoaL-like domain